MSETDSYFVDAVIEFNDKSYLLKKTTADRWVSEGNYWHSKAEPSTWLCEKAFSALKKKYQSLSQEALLALLAMAMEISVEKLVNAIRWHEEYMRWHEGIPEYSVLDESC